MRGKHRFQVMVAAVMLAAGCGGVAVEDESGDAGEVRIEPERLVGKSDLPGWMKLVVAPLGCDRQATGAFLGLASAHLYRLQAMPGTAYHLDFEGSYPASRGALVAVYRTDTGAKVAAAINAKSSTVAVDFVAPVRGEYLVLVASVSWLATGTYRVTVGCTLPRFPLVNGGALGKLLVDAAVQQYAGTGDGGVTHVTYWTMSKTSPAYLALAPEEQVKVSRVQGNRLHSQLFIPTQEVAGVETTGVLAVSDGVVARKQRVLLQVPSSWNGRLLVAGAPGLRNEYANQAIIAQWAVEQGYAFVSSDKGIAASGAELLGGDHPTQHWGAMMIDLALWARVRLADAFAQPVLASYAIGLSNGGYQTRRALELDHARVLKGEARIFDGGLDWAGAYWPDTRVLDKNGDGTVSPAEFAAGESMFKNSDRATLIMGWAYDPAGHTTPEKFATQPPYASVLGSMQAAGFTSSSSVYWGLFNTTYDSLKAFAPAYRGVGYYNLVSHVYRAELRGDGNAQAAAYSCYADPQNPAAAPPLYAWLAAAATDGGWDAASIGWALKNATTGEFSAPMISVHGDADALLPLPSHGLAYAAAVKASGKPSLHRLYVVTSGGHVDDFADGNADFDFDGVPGNEGVADLATPMQAYVMRAFRHLTVWSEERLPAPASTTIATDPTSDVNDPATLPF